MSVLPERWRGAASSRMEDTARLIAEAGATQNGKGRAGWAWGGWALATLLILGGLALDGSEAHGKSGVPYGRNTVISTESTGTGATLEDMSPQGHNQETDGGAAAVPPPSPSPAPSPRARPSVVRGDAPRSLAPAWADEPTEPLTSEADVLKSDILALPTPVASPALKGEPPTLNIGTRLVAAIEHPVTTAPSGSLVSARIVGDVVRGGRVVLPDGSALEGLAFATDEDDRVQMTFRAIVVGGKTVTLRGVALALDGGPGVPGKVIRKGSKGKGGVGRVLGAIGRVASLGFLGTGGSTSEQVAEDVLRSAGRDLGELERRWRRSDKVVRLAKDTQITVYLEADVVLP